MNTAGKIAAGTIAAAAIGGSALIVTNMEDPGLDAVDDVAAATVELPKVELPKVALPKIELAKVSTPEIETPELIESAVEVPDVLTYGLPAAEVAGGEIRSVPAAPVSAKTASVPGAVVPAETVSVPLIASGAERIRQVQAMLREAGRIADRRNLRYDPDFGVDSEAWKKWLAIYRKDEPYTLEPKVLPADLRIIAEAKCPADADQAVALGFNLDFYAEQGYNAVLLTFDTTEDIGRLLDTASMIRAHGLKIVCAYSGPEKLRWSVFRDPDLIEQYVSRVCAVSDAFLIGWRRTSCHLLTMDAPFRNHLLKAARKLNPEIAVIGEAFYGETASARRTVAYNVPANASAVLLFGIGYRGVAIEPAMDGVFDKVKNMPRIGLAIGEKPYYDTLHNTGKTFAENLKIKQRIEKRFRSGGCVGTLTIRGDGSDGIYNSKYTENLTLPYGKEEKMK